MNKKLINKPNILHTMYPYFWAIMIFLMLMPHIIAVAVTGEIGMSTIDIVSNMIATFLISAPIFALIFGLIFRKDTSKYGKIKKAEKYGKDLEILQVEYDHYVVNLINPKCGKHVFEVKYINNKGEHSEFITEEYEIPVLDKVLNWKNIESSINNVLSKLQFELKEYKNNKYLLVYADEKTIAEFKKAEHYRTKQDVNIPAIREIYNNQEVMDYLVNKLNNWLKKERLVVKLNQDISIEGKTSFDFMLSDLDYEKKEEYSTKSIINFLEHDDSIECLASLLNEKYHDADETTISIYVSNYSKEWEYYSMTIEVYY